MPLLPDLPPEILDQIMKYLLPDDVDNFCDSRGDFHAIAVRSLPRHKVLTNEYSNVYCGLFGYSERHPLFLLRDVLQDPDIVWYVKTMYIKHCDVYNEEREKESWVEADKIVVERKDAIVATVQACPYLDDEEREEWIEQILSLNKHDIVALLASMFPCLENISLINNWEKCSLHFLVEKVAQATRLNPRNSHALTKLQYFHEESIGTLILPEMHSFNPLSGLPSMRRFKSKRLQHGGWLASREKSAITRLEFDECMIGIKALESAFSGIANLQDFTYECYWIHRSMFSLNGWTRDWLPGHIILSLIKFAGHSLVSLDLTRNDSRDIQRTEAACRGMKRGIEENEEDEAYGADRDDEDDEDDEGDGILKPFMGSLRGFEVLKSLRVQNEMFVEQEAEDPMCQRTVHRLVDLLPASIVEVSLAKPLLNKKDSYRLMEGLPELKAERTPKLERVICEGFNHDNGMDKVFEADGIQLILSENGVMRKRMEEDRSTSKTD